MQTKTISNYVFYDKKVLIVDNRIPRNWFKCSNAHVYRKRRVLGIDGLKIDWMKSLKLEYKMKRFVKASSNALEEPSFYYCHLDFDWFWK